MTQTGTMKIHMKTAVANVAPTAASRWAPPMPVNAMTAVLITPANQCTEKLLKDGKHTHHLT